jgi:multisubunit Na+/H+ antiporter MnhG subunit
MLLMVSGSLLAWCGILTLRRADPVTPRMTAASVGAVAGAWASLAVSLQCALSDPIHTMGTHVLPVGIIMLVAARVGPRWLGLKKW